MVDQMAKSRADVHFKVREQQKADAPLARMEYEAAGVSVRENTVRLRALRLARDAELPGGKPKTGGKPKRRKPTAIPRACPSQRGNLR